MKLHQVKPHSTFWLYNESFELLDISNRYNYWVVRDKDDTLLKLPSCTEVQ